MDKHIDVFNELSTIYAAVLDDSDESQISYKELTIPETVTLLKTPEYSQSYAAFIDEREHHIYRGDGRYQFLTAEVIPGKRKSENTYNIYTRLFSDILPSWRPYPKRNRSFICTTSQLHAFEYVYHDFQVYCMFPKNNVKIGVCSNDDIWNSFPILNKYRIESLDEFNRFFITFLSKFSDLKERQVIDIFNTGNTLQLKQLFSKVEHNIKDYDVNKLHTKTLIKYIASTIKNDNRSIVDILNNDLLNPTVNGFKLLNNISKLPLINNESYELWFSGQCIMVSCSIMYECKELALKQ